MRVALLVVLSLAVTINAEIVVTKDIEYARVDGNGLELDLYLPEKQSGPLIVYVHGGAWRGGSKKEMPLNELVECGCPVASLDYRLSTVARFPAQAHDIK